MSSIVHHVTRRIPQALMTLAMIGAGLFLWIPSAAAAPTAPAASTITEFHVSNVGVPQGITAGPDGNLWFTYQDFTKNANAIGRITTSGVITLTPTPSANSGPTGITAGPDGNMWFTEASGNVGRITTR